MTDQEGMNLALELAAQGRGQVSPNPMVGAVVVQAGAIVGQGYHRYAERKHAEIWALEAAGEQARGATLYLNLEPCSHHGRTPPCADAVIAAGIKRVVAAMADPNPLVAGQGFARLQAAGIRVEVGLKENEARRLNEKFITYHALGRPFIHLKVAQSLDGRIATTARQSKWITGPEAREASQELRYESDAILVGIGTVLADDPELTMRLARPRHRPLVRIVLDERLQLPLDSKLVQTASNVPLWVVTLNASSPQAEALAAAGVTLIEAPARAGRFDLAAVAQELGRRGLTSLLVEGGAETNAVFLAARLLDKVTFFIAPKIIGGRTALGAIGGEGSARLEDCLQLDSLRVRQVGADLECTAYPRWPKGS